MNIWTALSNTAEQGQEAMSALNALRAAEFRKKKDEHHYMDSLKEVERSALAGEINPNNKEQVSSMIRDSYLQRTRGQGLGNQFGAYGIGANLGIDDGMQKYSLAGVNPVKLIPGNGAVIYGGEGTGAVYTNLDGKKSYEKIEGTNVGDKETVFASDGMKLWLDAQRTKRNNARSSGTEFGRSVEIGEWKDSAFINLMTAIRTKDKRLNIPNVPKTTDSVDPWMEKYNIASYDPTTGIYRTKGQVSKIMLNTGGPSKNGAKSEFPIKVSTEFRLNSFGSTMDRAVVEFPQNSGRYVPLIDFVDAATKAVNNDKYKGKVITTTDFGKIKSDIAKDMTTDISGSYVNIDYTGDQIKNIQAFIPILGDDGVKTTKSTKEREELETKRQKIFDTIHPTQNRDGNNPMNASDATQTIDTSHMKKLKEELAKIDEKLKEITENANRGTFAENLSKANKLLDKLGGYANAAKASTLPTGVELTEINGVDYLQFNSDEKPTAEIPLKAFEDPVDENGNLKFDAYKPYIIAEIADSYFNKEGK